MDGQRFQRFTEKLQQSKFDFFRIGMILLAPIIFGLAVYSYSRVGSFTPPVLCQFILVLALVTAYFKSRIDTFTLHLTIVICTTFVSLFLRGISFQSFSNPAVIWTAIIPGIAFYYLSKKQFFIISIWSGIQVLAIFLLHIFPEYNPYSLSLQNPPLFNFVSLVTAFITLTTVLYFQSLSNEQAYDDFNNSKEKQILQSHLATVKKMASGLAHEINNPLTIIYGRLNQLDKKLNRKGVEDFNGEIVSLRTSSKRIADSVARLAILFESSPNDNIEEILLSDMLDRVKKYHQKEIETLDIKWSTAGEEELKVKAHDFTLFQILSSTSGVLLNNLVHHQDRAIQAIIQPQGSEKIQISFKIKNSFLKRDHHLNLVDNKTMEQSHELSLYMAGKLSEKIGGQLFINNQNEFSEITFHYPLRS